MKWFFAALTVLALLATVIPDSGSPGWLRVTAALLSIAFASGAFTLWVLEDRKP